MKGELVNIKNQSLAAPGIGDEVLAELGKLNVGSEKIAKKLAQLMEANTLNNNGDIMPDNKVQLDALKLLLKMHGIRTDQGVNINLFNIPHPDDKLKY